MAMVRRLATYWRTALVACLVAAPLAATTVSSDLHDAVARATQPVSATAAHLPIALPGKSPATVRKGSPHRSVSLPIVAATAAAAVLLLAWTSPRRRAAASGNATTPVDSARAPPSRTAPLVPIGPTPVRAAGRSSRSHRVVLPVLRAASVR
ncbi:MAG TPA: hypothetical protein VFJ98_01945 [Mycobacteriales bacterium]|nr:hypothetical protein [Mycobacteriales bacterium]